MSKPCSIGSVGFPKFRTYRHRIGSFLLNKIISPNRHLDYTIIPIVPETNQQSRSFPWQITKLLAFFAILISYTKSSLKLRITFYLTLACNP